VRRNYFTHNWQVLQEIDQQRAWSVLTLQPEGEGSGLQSKDNKFYGSYEPMSNNNDLKGKEKEAARSFRKSLGSPIKKQRGEEDAYLLKG